MASNILCPNCEQPLSPAAKSCPHCGTSLQAPIQQSKLTSSELTQPLPDVVKQFDTSATTKCYNSRCVDCFFYSGAIFAGKVQVQQGTWWYALLYALPIGILRVALILALRVFYPNGFLTDDYLTLIKKKEQRLQASTIFLEVAIAILAVSVLVYLLRPMP